MTSDEAIYTLKNTAWLGSEEQEGKVEEAVQMAVEALKRETSGDAISRQAVIDTEGLDEQIRCEMCRNPMHTNRGCDGNCKYDEKLYERIMQILGERIKLLPSVQPVDKDINVSCKDAISRQAAIDIFDDYNISVENGDLEAYSRDRKRLCNLPSAQPERTCVNCGRTANNGGWYADGRTRCPIEEHYALPKDGYCHLWEKRSVTDDDYPERREE